MVSIAKNKKLTNSLIHAISQFGKTFLKVEYKSNEASAQLDDFFTNNGFLLNLQ